MPGATIANGHITTMNQFANKTTKGQFMTINHKIADVLIQAEVEDGSLKEWGEAIDEFAFNEAEQMTYGWDLDDEEFNSLKNGLKEAILAQTDFNKVDMIIAEQKAEALERVNDMLLARKDWGWK